MVLKSFVVIDDCLKQTWLFQIQVTQYFLHVNCRGKARHSKAGCCVMFAMLAIFLD